MPLKVKCVDICNGVENVAEPKPINYIMENLSHKWICPVCRNHNSVISSSFLTYFTDKYGSDFWIGANDIGTENDWVWESDNSKLLFSDWHVGEPNREDEDCGEIRWQNSVYKWNDKNCENDNTLYICEK